MTLKKHIPDAITSANLLCGIAGVICTLEGHPDTGLYWMIAAAVFDFCDGFAARLLHASSPVGKELDSLADIVSFGVLPSLMLYQLMTMSAGEAGPILWLRYTPLFIAVMSALRLAKFNIDERQHAHFLGLPTPACALICGSLSFFVLARPDSLLSAWTAGPVFIPLLSLLLGLLLISEIPMFSFKIKKGSTILTLKRTAFLSISAICLIAVIALRQNWSLFVLLTFLAYLVVNLVFALFPQLDQ